MYHRLLLHVVSALALVGAACTGGGAPLEPDAVAPPLDAARRAPTPPVLGRGIGTLSYTPAPRTKYPLEYHGGNVALGITHIYYIFYGDFDQQPGTPTEQVLVQLAIGLVNSPYYSINALYKDGYGASTQGVMYGRSIWDPYSRTATLTEADVRAVATSAITSGQFALDPYSCCSPARENRL